MRFARIIGRVTLNVAEPSYSGGRFLIGQVCSPADPVPEIGKPLSKGDSLVVYDKLGATVGDLIGYSDGGEAAAPFSGPTPCDAYNAAILDTVIYNPHTKE